MDRWPPSGTVYQPFGPPEQARHLIEAFLAQVRAGLSGEEREYMAACREPTIDSGTTPGGEHVLRVSWAGSELAMDWDGSFQEALESVEQSAATASYDVAGDYWVVGGWRTMPC